ncbi:helix-turn-helix domain-containing protein [Streptomyces zagrosensis]|uniref:Transcriptional regulator with XRE-family HTH domain n=1 Tax=Streptomyces zagrosensis TaxID=1042984 RepID=A0A7W9V1T3_9ACTN|nr:helix-turn-helix transcriptional regulator [Streptomyces zagrosensis]MBB5939525.1 transcriptional regulator with XRE-family HTH domain [Streptomyces zagrosensis]
MPHVQLVPTIRRRRLAQTLKKLRKDAGMTSEDVAAALGWQVPKLSKIENVRQQIQPAEVTELLKALGYKQDDLKNAEVFTALENLARDARKKPGWWQTYSGVVSPSYADYISLEEDAEQICEWTPLVIPGLLQTTTYARETIAGTTSSRTPEEIAALAEVRQARQAVLTRRDHPLALWAIIHETALKTRFEIRPTTMREQLRKLLDTTDMPNVTIQIMPSDSTAHPGILGGFSLVSFPGPTPDVVLLENLSGATYVEGDGTQPFTGALERIRATALSVEDSLARIAQIQERHRK